MTQQSQLSEVPSGPTAPRPRRDRIATVSTVRDSPAAVLRFVERNLRAGADHMFVVLDGDAPAVRAALSAVPEVTCIEATRSWWAGPRPAQLNVRQSVGANLVRAVLAVTDTAIDWLVHIDADEVLHVDRDRLLGLPDDVRTVGLRPLEAVSRPRRNPEPELFKRLLSSEELALLATLGVIDTPSNRAYFRGHLKGKPALRPSLDLRLGIHAVWDEQGNPVPGLEATWLRVLHLHCPDLETFRRRYERADTSEPRPRINPRRARSAAAVAALQSLGLARRRYERTLRAVYGATTRDDERLLRSLGLLVRVDLGAARYQPRPLSAEDLDRVATALEAIADAPKQAFRRGSGADIKTLVDRALDRAHR